MHILDELPVSLVWPNAPAPYDHMASKVGLTESFYNLRRINVARSDLARQLLQGIRGDQLITLSTLSPDGVWVALFTGPTNQLDLAWIASMSPMPFYSYVYRVEGAIHNVSSRIESSRDVTFLSDPDAPTIVDASARQIVLSWPYIAGCQAELLRQAMAQGGAAFQVEVSQGPAWQPARVQQQRLRLAARVADSQGRDADRQLLLDEGVVQIDDEDIKRIDHQNAKAFIPLQAVDGVGGVRVIDLLPATWYHIRLRVTYDGNSAALSPPVAVATKCGPPDTPVPRPRVAEEPVGATCRGAANDSDTPLILTARNANKLARELSRKLPSRYGGYRLRVSWPRPRANGYPIHHYILQQRELVLPPIAAGRYRANNETRRPSNPEAETGNSPFSTTGAPNTDVDHDCPKWTPWREVHAHLLPECLVRAPSRCPASITAARQALGFAVPAKNSSALSSSSETFPQPPPRFIAMEFRVAAVNALGTSSFSHVSRVTKHECPKVLMKVTENRSLSVKNVTDFNHPRSYALEAEQEELSAALGFPVSLGVVQMALMQCSHTKAPRAKRVCRSRPYHHKIQHLDPKQPIKTDTRLFSPAQRMVVTEMSPK